MFSIGQRVVCVDDDWSDLNARRLYEAPNRPIKGQIYIVRALHYEIDSRKTILLAEIINPPFEYRQPWGTTEPGFFIGRFRPLIERKTNISALQALLNPANHKYREDA